MSIPQSSHYLPSGVTEVPCEIPGKRSYNVRGVSFTIDKRYKIFKPIGVGAYGVVISAMDTSLGQMVALKKIGGLFDDLTDAKRVLREIRLMQAMSHDNILPLTDVEDPESMDSFNEIYMATPLYDKDLSKILAAGVTLTTSHIQYFIYQLLCALKYMHSASILHRDLKPANILIQESCDLALCDFGLARYVDDDEAVQRGMTEYVVTRWYRAPELVLTHSYSNAVDLWAVGCILGELLRGGEVLFPGRDFKHQVETICALLGKPRLEETKHVTSGRARRFLEGLPDLDGSKLRNLFEGKDPTAVDLMEKLLRFNPNERLTAAEALHHPFVQPFHDPDLESMASGIVDMSKIEPKGVAGGTPNKEELKRMMLREIFKFRPDAHIFRKHPELAL